MVKVEVANTTQRGKDRVAEAVVWCMNHLPQKTWDLTTKWPSKSYEFQFKNPEDATHFALKWA
jgi:hypothetical protein